MNADRVTRLALCSVEASAKTRWSFIRVATASGAVGFGEATLPRPEPGGLEEATARMRRHVVDRDAHPAILAAAEKPRTLAQAAVFSATEQALWDLWSRARNVCVAEALGGALRNPVPLYANINRRTLDRSPEGFGASARDARSKGFDILKIAPFDEVTRALRHASAGVLRNPVWRVSRRCAPNWDQMASCWSIATGASTKPRPPR